MPWLQPCPAHPDPASGPSKGHGPVLQSGLHKGEQEHGQAQDGKCSYPHRNWTEKMQDRTLSWHLSGLSSVLLLAVRLDPLECEQRVQGWVKPYSHAAPWDPFCGRKSVNPILTANPNSFLPGTTFSVCQRRSCFSPFAAFHRAPQTQLHSYRKALPEQQAKVSTKGQSSSPAERESNALKFKLACDKSSGFAPQHVRADVLSSSQDTACSVMDGINLQFAPCSSVLVFSYVMSAAGRM